MADTTKMAVKPIKDIEEHVMEIIDDNIGDCVDLDALFIFAKAAFKEYFEGGENEDDKVQVEENDAWLHDKCVTMWEDTKADEEGEADEDEDEDEDDEWDYDDDDDEGEDGDEDGDED
jgi:hypothetical protein